MANAIPVHSEPKRKPAVKASPEYSEEQGKVVDGDYAAAAREGLGNPADFAETPVVGDGVPILHPVTGQVMGWRKDH